MLRLAPILIALATITDASGAGDPREPLTRAFEASDQVGLMTIGRASSARALAGSLESGNRVETLAAILAAPHSDEAPKLLDALGRIAHSPDRSVALAAARAAIAIAESSDSARLAELEVLRAELGGALRSWHALARDDSRWADVRVLALEITAYLAGQLAGKPAAAVVELIGDSDPEVRAAAFELLPSPLPTIHAERIGAAIETETENWVALAAAVSLCGPLAFGDDAGVASALKPAGQQRLETLILDRELSAELRLEAARCAAVLGQRDLLSKFAKTVPKAVAAKARALAKTASDKR